MGRARCLITGADGFVGSNVLEYLLAHTDWEFTCICSWRHHGTPLNIKPSPRVTVVTHDLTGPLPEMGNFDYILNLASESHVDRSISNPVEFVENNVSSVLQVLEYAREHPPKVFVHFSTDEVYGATDHGEWDVLLPSNPYAASKAAQEMIAIAYWKTYKIPLVITNSNNIVGKNQNPEKFTPKIAQLIREGKTVAIHATNGKPGRRHYNPVQNVANALHSICELTPSLYGDRPEKYSLPGGTEMDNLEMANLVADILRLPLKYKLVDVETVRPGYDEFYASLSSELNLYEPLIDLREGLAWLDLV